MMDTTSKEANLKNKKGLHEQYRLLRRPTFSDLVGPVRLYPAIDSQARFENIIMTLIEDVKWIFYRIVVNRINHM